MRSEANFAGQVSFRSCDGITLAGTSQVNTPLGKHLINAEIAEWENQKKYQLSNRVINSL